MVFRVGRVVSFINAQQGQLLNHVAMPIHVFLISDFRLLVQGLTAVLQSKPEHYHVLGSASTLDMLELPWRHPAPDVVLVDLETNPAQVVPWLQHWRAQGGPKMLLLTRHDNPVLPGQAISAGACGLIDRHASAAQMLVAIEKVHQGQVWLDHQTTAHLLQGLAKRPATGDPGLVVAALLSKREQQIVAMLLRHGGDPARRLAERLHISESTLRNHLTSVYEKFGVSNRSGLMAHAMQNGLAAHLAN